MYKKGQHGLSVLDFVNTNYNTTFVKFNGFDAVTEKKLWGRSKIYWW